MFATFAVKPTECRQLGVVEVRGFRGTVCEMKAEGIQFTPTLTHSKLLLYPSAGLVIFTTANGPSSTRDGAMVMTASQAETRKIWQWFGKKVEHCPNIRPPDHAVQQRPTPFKIWHKLFQELRVINFQQLDIKFKKFINIVQTMSEAMISIQWVEGWKVYSEKHGGTYIFYML